MRSYLPSLPSPEGKDVRVIAHFRAAKTFAGKKRSFSSKPTPMHNSAKTQSNFEIGKSKPRGPVESPQVRWDRDINGLVGTGSHKKNRARVRPVLFRLVRVGSGPVWFSRVTSRKLVQSEAVQFGSVW